MANEEPFGAQGKAFVGKTCLDTTHLANNLEDGGGTQRHHGSRDGKQSSLRRWRGGEGEPGKNGGGVSVSLTALLSLRETVSVPVSQDTIGPNSNCVSLIGRALFLATIESYLASVSYIALLLPSFSEMPPSR